MFKVVMELVKWELWLCHVTVKDVGQGIVKVTIENPETGENKNIYMEG